MAAFQLSQVLLGVLVNSGILTPQQAQNELLKLARANEGGGPGNAVAKRMFEQMVRSYSVPPKTGQH
jgi:hypothetical protein